MTNEEKLKEIVPGKTYPVSVRIQDPEGKVKFLLNSFEVGMYCAIYWGSPGMPQQCGDHDNKGFVRKLKQDIKKAIKRGADVEIGAIRPIKTLEDAS